MRKIIFTTIMLLCVSTAIAQNYPQGVRNHLYYDDFVLAYTPVQIIENPTTGQAPCFWNITKTLRRCDSHKGTFVGVKAQFTPGMELFVPREFHDSPGSWNSIVPTLRIRTTVTVYHKTTGAIISQSSATNTSTIGNINNLTVTGTGWIINQSSLNSIMPTVGYTHSNEHTITTYTVVDRNRRVNLFTVDWYTLETFWTCKSSVNNVNGSPNFTVLNSNYQGNSYPQHFETCISNVHISTQNTCNNAFHLFVAEINEHWQRPQVKEAERWFSVSNRQINLQLFTQGIGEFSNVQHLSSGPFIMTGGTVTWPNPNNASGERYFMVVVATTAPNWTTSVKAIKMLNCLNEGDSTLEASAVMLEVEDLLKEKPELAEQIEMLINNYVYVYPNPSADEVRIRYNAEKGNLKSLCILSEQGNVIKRVIPQSDLKQEAIETEAIDIRKFKTGFYTIQLEYEDGRVEYTKFVKN